MQGKNIKVVAAIIKSIDKEGNLVLLSAKRGYGEYKGKWEFPGGKIENWELPREALIREIREELDVEIVVGELVTSVEYDYPSFHLSMDCFCCQIVSGKPELKEHEDTMWTKISELDLLDWLPADKKVVEILKSTV